MVLITFAVGTRIHQIINNQAPCAVSCHLFKNGALSLALPVIAGDTHRIYKQN